MLSGPAGGLAGARHAAGLLDTANLVAFDAGGTSTDISMVVAGSALSADRSVAGERIALPSLDIVTLGAGGGSIASVDPGGLLRVGPKLTRTRLLRSRRHRRHGDRCQSGPRLSRRGWFCRWAGSAGCGCGGARSADIGRAARRRRGDSRCRCAPCRQHRMAEGIRLATVRLWTQAVRAVRVRRGGWPHVTELARMLDLGRVVVPGSPRFCLPGGC